MRYWLFQNNQVNGPYEPEALTGLPMYSPESLVCPETSSGTSMGDWQRAGMVPDLSSSLARAGAPNGGKGPGLLYENLPPEPTLQDLAAVHDVQEKLSVLEKTVLQIEEEMRLKDSELVGLHQEIKDKNGQILELKSKLEGLGAELGSKVGGLEQRIAPLPALKESLEQASGAQRNVESALQTQRQTLAEINLELERIRGSVGEINGLREKIQDLAALKPAVDDLARLKAEVGEISKLKSELQEIEAKLAEPKITPEPVAASPAGAMPNPMPLASQTIPFMPESPAPSAIPSPSPIAPPAPFTPAPPPAIAKPAAVPPLPAKAPAPAQAASSAKKSKLPIILLGLALLGGGAYFSGLLTPPQKPQEAAVSLPAPAPEPAAELALQTQPPAAPEDPRKTAALDMLKAWPAASGKTLGAELEAIAPSAGGLSPWMAENIKDNIFQINFYAPPSASRPQRTVFEFEVRLDDNKVVARNESALSLLQAPPPASAAKRPAGKSRKRLVKAPAAAQTSLPKPPASDEDSLDELLKPVPAKNKSADGGQPLEELLPGVGNKPADRSIGEEAPAPKAVSKPAKSERRKSKAAAEPDDAALLDDLLKP